jgi:YD repeat-containing protein
LKTQARNGKTILSYQTDKNGNITQVTDANGDYTGYTYDLNARLKTVTDNEAVAATYSYNPDNTISGIVRGTGISSVYGYDSDRNIISFTNRRADGSTLESYSYTYDNNGNQLSKTENGQTTAYAYDKLNRLTKENNCFLSTAFPWNQHKNSPFSEREFPAFKQDRFRFQMKHQFVS